MQAHAHRGKANVHERRSRETGVELGAAFQGHVIELDANLPAAWNLDRNRGTEFRASHFLILESLTEGRVEWRTVFFANFSGKGFVEQGYCAIPVE